MHFTFFDRFIFCTLISFLIILAFYTLNERTPDGSKHLVFHIPLSRNRDVNEAADESLYKIAEKEEDEEKKPDVTADVAGILTAKGYISYDKIEEEVFRPLGLKIVDTGLFPKLEYLDEPRCEEVFASWLVKSAAYNESATPPRDVPAGLERNFTLDGHSHITKGYRDDRSGVKSAKWSNINDLVQRDIELFYNQSGNYGRVGIAMYTAMRSYSLEGKVGVIIGSRSPWVESFALRNGAEQITTVEYMKIEVIGTTTVTYKHPVEMAKQASSYFSTYDFAASFSSIEHSGLGRYGDVPDPIGDIREMLKVRCLLKPKGLFFFGVPAGPDCLHWNLHRIYGRIRLAIMFAGFELLDIYERDLNYPMEFTDADFGTKLVCSPARQPVFVLRKSDE